MWLTLPPVQREKKRNPSPLDESHCGRKTKSTKTHSLAQPHAVNVVKY